jgi:hypothetical protein
MSVAAFVGVRLEDDPYDTAFTPPSAIVVFGAAPCTTSAGAFDNELSSHATPALMSMSVQRRWAPSPAEWREELAARVREITNLIFICTFCIDQSSVLPPCSDEVPCRHVIKLTQYGFIKINAAGEAKDRLGTRGDRCTRISGVPTYSPCVKWPVFQLFWVVAVAYGAAMVQCKLCDVVNAFMQALLSDHPGIPLTYMPVPRHT